MAWQYSIAAPLHVGQTPVSTPESTVVATLLAVMVLTLDAAHPACDIIHFTCASLFN